MFFKFKSLHSQFVSNPVFPKTQEGCINIPDIDWLELAYHEAGHAIMTLHSNVVLENISIIGKDKITTGNNPIGNCLVNYGIYTPSHTIIKIYLGGGIAQQIYKEDYIPFYDFMTNKKLKTCKADIENIKLYAKKDGIFYQTCENFYEEVTKTLLQYKNTLQILGDMLNQRLVVFGEEAGEIFEADKTYHWYSDNLIPLVV